MRWSVIAFSLVVTGCGSADEPDPGSVVGTWSHQLQSAKPGDPTELLYQFAEDGKLQQLNRPIETILPYCMFGRYTVEGSRLQTEVWAPGPFLHAGIGDYQFEQRGTRLRLNDWWFDAAEPFTECDDLNPD